MNIPGRRGFFKLAASGLALFGASRASAETSPSRQYIKTPPAQKNSYSMAVVTQGGKTIWLAGDGAPFDPTGKSLAGDFDAQTRQTFANLSHTLEKAGGKLSDMVWMIASISDPQYERRFLDIRKEIFGDDFPASALRVVPVLLPAGMLVSVQGVAVVA